QEAMARSPGWLRAWGYVAALLAWFGLLGGMGALIWRAVFGGRWWVGIVGGILIGTGAAQIANLISVNYDWMIARKIRRTLAEMQRHRLSQGPVVIRNDAPPATGEMLVEELSPGPHTVPLEP